MKVSLTRPSPPTVSSSRSNWRPRVPFRTGDRFLVDATEFLLRDADGVADSLPGTYRLERSRSAIYLPRTKGFPQNTELEATLTFVRERTDEERPVGRGSVQAVTPSAEAVTVRQHHSLVELPDDAYRPRAYDPRSGFGSMSFVDYAAPLGADMTRRFVRRHRLKKVDPFAESSEAVEPIVYYLDRGTPEPVRSALLEGARWWNQAFEAAGYRDAFRVEMMPDGADSLDVRYNVIQWVHRSTRGWSYGNSVIDPRTGEIIKGHVTLGSLRVRQDYLIAEGLLSPYAEGMDSPPELSEMALARIRQLSAHEVGHTLGLGHNYYASQIGRISVMDYPHPLVTVGNDGQVDLSDAYDVDIGEWDKVAIDFSYRDYPESSNEAAELEIPRDVIALIPPRPAGYGRSRELFPRLTGPMFDAVSPAIVAATMTVSQILEPARAARVVEQYALEASQLGLEELIEQLVTRTFEQSEGSGYRGEIARAVQRVVVEQLMELAGRAPMTQVRAVTMLQLETLAAALEGTAGTPAEQAHRQLLTRDITRFLSRPGANQVEITQPQAPPGSPIGDPALEWLAGLDRWCDWER